MFKNDISDDELFDIVTVTDSFDEQIKQLQDKRIATRIKAMDFVNKALHKNVLVELVGKWKLTLFEIIEKNLRKTPEEIQKVCTMASLISLQLGTSLSIILEALTIF